MLYAHVADWPKHPPRVLTSLLQQRESLCSSLCITLHFIFRAKRCAFANRWACEWYVLLLWLLYVHLLVRMLCSCKIILVVSIIESRPLFHFLFITFYGMVVSICLHLWGPHNRTPLNPKNSTVHNIVMLVLLHCDSLWIRFALMSTGNPVQTLLKFFTKKNGIKKTVFHRHGKTQWTWPSHSHTHHQKKKNKVGTKNA